VIFHTCAREPCALLSAHYNVFEICGYYLATLLNRTPIFDRCVVKMTIEKQTLKDTCLKSLDYVFNLFTFPHSLVEAIGRTYM
jgi:hypothetical protein